MPNSTEISSSKIFIGKVFEMWFRIPEYQRPYVWGDEEIDDLLEDLTYAATNKPEDEYFLGSFVYQARPANPSQGLDYAENDLLDGQQRLTTMLLLFAVMRDLSPGDEEASKEVRENCQACVYQKANKTKKIPERMRLSYHVRPEVERFLDDYVKKEGWTLRGDDGHFRFEAFVAGAEDVSVRNIAKAIEKIGTYLTDGQMMPLGDFLSFLINRVLMIYVSTENMEDAFRLFTILNNRGVPLRSSDILKTTNLGQIKNEAERRRFAQMWEGAEGELQDDFDRFLNYLRTILVKDKARLNLLQEFEERIYDPKEKDKTTGQVKPRLLERGKPTFEFVERYLRHYRTLLSGDNYQTLGSFEFDNLVGVMQAGLPSTDWIPPLLRFHERFGTHHLVDFLHAVNRKFGGDWLSQQTPSDRIAAMNTVIGEVEKAVDAPSLLASNVFAFDQARFRAELAGDIYHRRFAKYVMLMLDFLYSNQSLRMQFSTLSVEHILPQNPAGDSQWMKDFTEDQRKEWTHRLGNLVLITRRKNTSQGRLDYAEKKQRYFQKNIDTCPNSLRVLNGYSTWTPVDLMNNHKTAMAKLLEYFGVPQNT